RLRSEEQDEKDHVEGDDHADEFGRIPDPVERTPAEQCADDGHVRAPWINRRKTCSRSGSSRSTDSMTQAPSSRVRTRSKIPRSSANSTSMVVWPSSDWNLDNGNRASIVPRCSAPSAPLITKRYA